MLLTGRRVLWGPQEACSLQVMHRIRAHPSFLPSYLHSLILRSTHYLSVMGRIKPNIVYLPLSRTFSVNCGRIWSSSSGMSFACSSLCGCWTHAQPFSTRQNHYTLPDKRSLKNTSNSYKRVANCTVPTWVNSQPPTPTQHRYGTPV